MSEVVLLPGKVAEGKGDLKGLADTGLIPLLQV